MVDIYYGRAGSGKTAVLEARAKKLYGEGVRVIFVVPEQLSMTREARFGGKIEALSFSRLCDTVFRALGGAAKRKPDGVMTTAAIWRAVNEVSRELKYYRRSAKRGGFIAKLTEAFSELETCCITPEAVAAVPMNEAARRKYADLFRIHARYRELWSGEFRAPGDEIADAAALLELSPLFKDAVFMFDGFYGFTEQQLLLVRQIIAQAAGCCFAFSTDMEDDLFYTVTAEAKKIERICRTEGVKCVYTKVSEQSRRLESDTLQKLERLAFSPDGGEFDADGSFTVYHARDAAEELGYIACRIKNDALSGKYRYRDVAVLAPDSDEAAALAKAVFAKHGVPAYTDSKKTLLSEPLCAAVLAALNAVTDGYYGGSVFEFLKTGLAGLEYDGISKLENYVRLWNVRGKAWLSEWTRNPYGVDERTHGDESERLALINSLRESAITPLTLFEQELKKAADCRGLLTAVWGLVSRLDIEDKLNARADEYARRGLVHESDVCARVLGKFASMLDGICEVCGDTALSLTAFYELITACAGCVTLSPRPAGADEVLFAGIGRARPEGVKCAYVCRMTSGAIPRAASDRGLITDAERRLFSSHGIATSMDFVKSAIRERFDLYSAMTCASRELVMSCHFYSPKGDRKQPSPFLEAAERIAHVTALTSDGLEPEFYLVSRAGAADLAAGGRYLPETDVRPFEDPHDDSDLPPDVVGRLYGDGLWLSSSGLSAYFECPFKFFMRNGMKMRVPQEVTMGANGIGTLIHWGFQHLLSGEYDLENADDEKIRGYTRKIMDDYLEGPLKDTKNYSNRYDRTFRKAARVFTQSAPVIVNELRNSGFKPLGFEMDISGFVPETELPNGGKLHLTGIIDRVDVMEKDGVRYAKIIDYKSGNAKFDVTDIYNGTKLQLPLYAGAVKSGFPDTEIAAMYYIKTGNGTQKYKNKPLSDEQYEKETEKKIEWDGAFSGEPEVQGELGVEVDGKAIFTKEAMDGIIEMSAGKIAEAAKGISCGNVSVSPLEGACKYCDYSDLCRINEHPEKKRTPETLPEDILK